MVLTFSLYGDELIPTPLPLGPHLPRLRCTCETIVPFSARDDRERHRCHFHAASPVKDATPALASVVAVVDTVNVGAS